jgi:hypothetical protein
MMLNNWQADGETLRQLTFANKEKQVILGTLLGNSSIIKPRKSKNPHFQMRESVSKNGIWIRCKAHELQRFSRPKSFVQDKDSFRWNSISCSCWNEFYDLCYKDNTKNITELWLDQLQDYGVACWFMDKGEFKKNSASLRISRLSESSVQAIKNYFQILGIDGEIKKFGGSKIISFAGPNLAKFMKIFSHRLPVYYKLQFNKSF